MKLDDLRRDPRYQNDWHRYCVSDERWRKIWTQAEREAWIRDMETKKGKDTRGVPK